MVQGTNRRNVIKGIGAAGVAGLAGCLGGGGDGDGDGTDTDPSGGDTDTPGGDGTDAPSGRELKLGILMGVTGGLEQLGPPIRDSAQLAVDFINDSDTSFSVDSQFEDTQTDPNAGISAAEALVSGGYPMIAGALSSTVTIQTAQNVSIPNEVVQISPASTAPSITDLQDNDFVYRTTPTDALQSQVMAQIGRERLEAQTTSYLALNNDYGQGLAQAYASAFEERGGEVLAEVSFEPEQSSYTSRLNQALSDDPDLLMIVGYPASGVQIFRDYYADYSVDDHDIIVPDGLKDSELPGDVGHDMSNVWGTAPLSIGPGNDFFESLWDEVPTTPFIAQSFDAAAVLMLANAAAGENNGAAIRDQVRAVSQGEGTKVTPEGLPEALSMAANGESINYEGASGVITFDDAGDIAEATYELYLYNDSGLERQDEITYSG